MIRPAILDDLPVVRVLYKYGDACHRDALPGIFASGPEPIRSEAYLLSCINDASGALHMAMRDNRPAGLVYVVERQPPPIALLVPRRYAQIDTLVVLPWAQRAGVATALLEGCEDWARARGLSDLELGVYEFNAGALALYHAMGYETQRRTMVKRLAGARPRERDRTEGGY